MHFLAVVDEKSVIHPTQPTLAIHVGWTTRSLSTALHRPARGWVAMLP